MTKVLLKLLLLLLLTMMLVSCTNQGKEDHTTFVIYEEDGYLISEYAKISLTQIEYIKFEESRFENADDFLEEIDSYVESISSYLNRENWKDNYTAKHGDDFEFKIKIKLTQGPSQVKGGYNQYKYLPLEVNFNEQLLETNKAPIAHEVTHLILPYYSSLSLREGLACILQDEIGKNPSVFNFGESPHDLTHSYLTNKDNSEYTQIVASVGEVGVPEHIKLDTSDIESRRAFYIFSHSFSKYLVEEYGMEKFLDAYDSNNLLQDYQIIYNMSLDELKEKWIEMISQTDKS